MGIDYEKEMQKLEIREQALITKYETCCNKLNEMLREDAAVRKKLDEKQQDNKIIVVIGCVISFLILIYLMVNF